MFHTRGNRIVKFGERNFRTKRKARIYPLMFPLRASSPPRARATGTRRGAPCGGRISRGARVTVEGGGVGSGDAKPRAVCEGRAGGGLLGII